MAGLKEIRKRISSVKTTRQVTSAMKMVSSSKLKKAQKALAGMRPYTDKLHHILTTISSNLENVDIDSVYTQQRDVERVLIVLVASNKGLAGSFNAAISKKAIKLAREKYAEQLANGNVDFYTFGKHADIQLKIHKMKESVKSNHDIYDDLSFNIVAEEASAIMEQFKDQTYDRVELVYNQFENAATQIPTIEQFLPVEIEELDDTENDSKLNYDFIYEPSMEEIITELIPRALKIQFYSAFLESEAAEHGARMTAMHQATDNATDLIDELTLKFNKARQAAITGEILEIVSGAEALNG